MASASTKTEPIADRRRTRFAPNGGPRPTARHRRQGRRGIAAAREILASIERPESIDRVRKPLPPEQLELALTGIAAARERLEG